MAKLRVFSLCRLTAFSLAVMVMGTTPLPAKEPKKAEPKPQSQERKQKAQTFGDWTVSCETAPDGKEACFAQQHQTIKESGQTLIQVAIGYLGPKRESVAVVTLPLGIDLRAGAAFKVDEGEQVPMVLQRCVNAGCTAAAQLSSEALKALIAGKVMRVGMLPWGGQQTVAIPVSLNGLREAIDTLK